ncbi:unnamed protein product, partial [Mesorhabditis belari]|uniref:Aquaporin n=1 Tax=Mesorhabditis belari TaxID=2138241 RepID=A0AAF3JA83_9BILA
MGRSLLPDERLRRAVHLKNRLIVNLLGEFFGTFVFIFIGLCVSMQYVLGRQALSTFIQVNFGWGLALGFCVYLLTGSSGGHLNPAVSFCFFTLGRLPFHHLVLYTVVQTIGAFLSAFCAYFYYFDQFEKFAGGERSVTGPFATAGAFTSFPDAHVSHVTCFVDQIVGTACLTFFITVFTDKRNKIPSGIVALLVVLFALNLGYPINPARDFGPRLFACLVYGREVFSYSSYYFWIPMVAPFIGGPLGGWLYHIFVGVHIPYDIDDEDRPETAAV